MVVVVVVVVVAEELNTSLHNRNHSLPQQEEVHRQSSIAQRSIALLEVSAVQRDNNYEETKLVVKYRQGKEASKLFGRQRRLPALFGGGLLFSAGFSLILSPILFEAPVVYASLGMLVGFLPGATALGLALHPEDELVIKRIFVGMLSVGIAWFCFQVVRFGTVLVYFTRGTCVDYRDASAPCWLAAIHIAMTAANTLLCFEIIVRRIFVSLYTKRNISGRFVLIWGIWGRFLLGITATATVFVLPYSFFAEGREFLSSPTGVVVILETLMTAALATLALTPRLYSGVQTWLSSQFGTVTDAMAVATLMSQGGDKPLEEVMATAKGKLRYVTLSSMSVSDFEVSGGGRSDKYSKSVQCRPRDIDLFVSHSWSDPPLEKWKVLKEYCNEFEKKYNREARLWLDMFCLDPDVGSEPQYHPVYMMSSERMLVLKGPTFKEKLWCACELLMWVEAGGSTSTIDVLPIAGCTLSVDDDWVDPFEMSKVRTSPKSAFQLAMLEVVRACGSLIKWNSREKRTPAPPRYQFGLKLVVCRAPLYLRKNSAILLACLKK